MIKTILVPLDGSELAESILPYVEMLGKATGAELLLLSVILEREAWGEYPIRFDPNKQTAGAQKYLEARRSELKRKGLKAKIDVAYGPEAQAILDTAADADVDLIAMTTHGRSGPARWIFGSVAGKVLHSTHRPLLLVRGSEEAQRKAKPPTISKILVPLDGSPLSLGVLPFVEDLAKAIGASLILFHAVPPLGIGPEMDPAQSRVGDILKDLQTQAYEFLTQVAKEVEERGLTAYSVSTIGPAVDAIVDTAEGEGVGLIAMATHGRTGMERWIMGSVADATVRRTTLPCLFVRPIQAEKAP